jgi:galactokinase
VTSRPPSASGREGIDPALVRRVEQRFAERFGSPAPRLAVAPGRVNLIGEHTDYNDGFVLPMAIGRATVIAFRPRADRRLRAHAVAFGETKEIDLARLRPLGGSDWLSYVAGVAWALADEGCEPPGLDAVIDGDVPIGAGLSSSASLELAAARAFAAAAALPWDPVRMAKLGQRAENKYVGMNCGLMDQFASAVSREGCALLLDCRSLATEPVPLPAGTAVVVMDTGARRALAGSAYNDRRAACEAAVAALAPLAPGIRALRDVTLELLERGRDLLDPVVLKRARHVVPENLRPREMADALRAGDLGRAGCLMNESHASLRDLYEVSSPELDVVTELARARPECHGARMTGAGFGGCAVALVAATGADAFIESVAAAYHERVDLAGAFFAGKPAAGARLWE